MKNMIFYYFLLVWGLVLGIIKCLYIPQTVLALWGSGVFKGW